MRWDKFAVCEKCGYHEEAIGDHANVFRKVCPSCGNTNWKTGVVGQRVFTGKWWNPPTWFDTKLVTKEQ